jgi:hypothetical protein
VRLQTWRTQSRTLSPHTAITSHLNIVHGRNKGNTYPKYDLKNDKNPGHILKVQGVPGMRCILDNTRLAGHNGLVRRGRSCLRLGPDPCVGYKFAGARWKYNVSVGNGG